MAPQVPPRVPEDDAIDQPPPRTKDMCRVSLPVSLCCLSGRRQEGPQALELVWSDSRDPLDFIYRRPRTTSHNLGGARRTDTGHRLKFILGGGVDVDDQRSGLGTERR